MTYDEAVTALDQAIEVLTSVAAVATPDRLAAAGGLVAMLRDHGVDTSLADDVLALLGDATDVLVLDHLKQLRGRPVLLRLIARLL